MSNKEKLKRMGRKIRHRRVRAKVTGTGQCPRLAVFRSNKHIYAQLIDDQNQRTLAQSSDLALKKNKPRAKKIDLSKSVGQVLGRAAVEKGFNEVVFDRGGYRYHGRVKALAEGLREAGVKF